MMLPNSMKVKKFSYGRTKIGPLIQEIAAHSIQKVSKVLQKVQFSLATDGSNDSDNYMHHIVVTFFDELVGQVTSKLFSLPWLEGDSIGKNIASLIIQVLKNHNISFENCISLSCDNANVMTEKTKDVYAFLKIQQLNLFLMGVFMSFNKFGCQERLCSVITFFWWIVG